MRVALLASLAFQVNNLSPVSLAQTEIGDILHSQILATSVSFDFIPDYLPAKRTVTITGYSSTPDQTDDSPFITASGRRVRDGIIASNFLKFGTKVKIPSVFGDKIFIVEDRMHSRFSDRVDIWFSNRSEAVKFGKRQLEIVVL